MLEKIELANIPTYLEEIQTIMYLSEIPIISSEDLKLIYSIMIEDNLIWGRKEWDRKDWD